MYANLLRNALAILRTLMGEVRDDPPVQRGLSIVPKAFPAPLKVRTTITPDTWKILDLLKDQRGDVHAPAGKGKSIALLLYANELRSKGHVVILVSDSRVADHLKSLSYLVFEQVLDVKITWRTEDLRGVDFILIDEPANLSIHQRDALRWFRPKVMGAVHRTYAGTISNHSASFSCQ